MSSLRIYVGSEAAAGMLGSDKIVKCMFLPVWVLLMADGFFLCSTEVACSSSDLDVLFDFLLFFSIELRCK